MKGALLGYFRFKRNMISGTEVYVSYGISDVLSTNRKVIYETEVKTSISDLRADFKNKKTKHHYMNKESEFKPQFQPNYFYFAVPGDLYYKAKEIIDTKKYGIIVVNSYKDVVIMNKAKKLHNDYSERLFEALIKRISSELANKYEELNLIKDEHLDWLKEKMNSKDLQDVYHAQNLLVHFKSLGVK
jgi:hypothetical protein